MCELCQRGAGLHCLKVEVDALVQLMMGKAKALLGCCKDANDVTRLSVVAPDLLVHEQDGGPDDGCEVAPEVPALVQGDVMRAHDASAAESPIPVAPDGLGLLSPRVSQSTSCLASGVGACMPAAAMAAAAACMEGRPCCTCLGGEGGQGWALALLLHGNQPGLIGLADGLA